MKTVKKGSCQKAVYRLPGDLEIVQATDHRTGIFASSAILPGSDAPMHKVFIPGNRVFHQN